MATKIEHDWPTDRWLRGHDACDGALDLFGYVAVCSALWWMPGIADALSWWRPEASSYTLLCLLGVIWFWRGVMESKALSMLVGVVVLVEAAAFWAAANAVGAVVGLLAPLVAIPVGMLGAAALGWLVMWFNHGAGYTYERIGSSVDGRAAS